MKVFRKIYYIVLPLLAIVLCSLTFLNSFVSAPKSRLSESEIKGYASTISSAGNHDAYDNAYSASSSQYKSRSDVTLAITDALKNDRFTTYYNSAGTTDSKMSYSSASGCTLNELLISSYNQTVDGETETVWTLTPVFHSKVYTLVSTDLAKIPSKGGEFGAAPSVKVQNVIAYVPGIVTRAATTINEVDKTFSVNESELGDVIMLTAHYDSTVGDNGYANNGVAVGSLIALYKKLASGEIECRNDVLFVFSDSSYKAGLGLGAFLYTDLYDSVFAGVKNRIKIAANFSGAKGNGSSVIMGGATDSAYGELAGFASTFNKHVSSAFLGNIYRKISQNGDFEMMKGLSAIDFLTLGDENSITYESDIDSSLVNQMSALAYSFVDYFKDKNLKGLSTDVSASFYSYLNADFYYPVFVGYIWGGLIIAVLAVAAFFIVKKKAYDLKKIAFGALVAAVTAVCTAVGCFVTYIIAALLLGVFGVINLSSIFTLTISSPVFAIAAFLAALAFHFGFCSIFKGVFGAKSTDVVRGGAILSALAGAVWCFVSPATSYVLALAALPYAAILLVSVLTKDAFRSKFGFDIERMFFYACAAAVLLPITLAETVLLGKFAPAYLAAIAFALLSPFFCSVSPYVDFFLAAIKPRREESATVPDNNAQVPQNEETAALRKKKDVPYANRSLLCVTATLIAAATITLCSVISPAVFTQSHLAGTDGIYKNALVYSFGSSGGENDKKIIIKDLDFYSKYKAQLQNFRWSDRDGAYVMNDDTSDADLPIKAGGPLVQLDANKNMFVLENKTNDVEFTKVTIESLTTDFTIGYVNIVGSLSSSSVTTGGMSETAYRTTKSEDGRSVTAYFPAGYGTRNAIEVFASGAPKSGEGKVRVTVEEKIICGDIYGFGILDGVAKNNSEVAKLRTALSGMEGAPNIYVNMVCRFDCGVYTVFKN